MNEFTYEELRKTLDTAYANGLSSKDEDNIWRVVDLARRLSELLVAAGETRTLSGSDVDDFYKLFYSMNTSRFDIAIDKVVKSLKAKRQKVVSKKKEEQK